MSKVISAICLVVFLGALTSEARSRSKNRWRDRRLSSVESRHSRSHDFRLTRKGKSANVYANPLGALFGNFQVGLDFAVARNVTLGPIGSFYYGSAGPVTSSGFGIGARSNFYVMGDAIASGAYIAPSLSYVSMSSSVEFPNFSRFGFDEEELSLEVTASGYAASVTGGYHFVFSNGFNFLAGIGIAYINFNEVEFDGVGIFPAPISGFGPTLEAAIGYAF